MYIYIYIFTYIHTYIHINCAAGVGGAAHELRLGHILERHGEPRGEPRGGLAARGPHKLKNTYKHLSLSLYIYIYIYITVTLD